MSGNIILLAEDDLEDAKRTREALRAAGAWNQVVRTIDGAETLAYLKGEGNFADRQAHPFPSILLLDLKMPRLHGFQVLDWIRRNVEPRKMLVVVLSGFTELEAVRLAYEMGAHSFLTKPCIPEEIRNLMKLHSRYWQSTVAECTA